MSEAELRGLISDLTLQISRLADKVERIDTIFKDIKLFSIKVAAALLSTGIIAAGGYLIINKL